jgi:hypothetical protein
MAEAAGNEWVSPAWPVDADYVQAAHAAGVKVVPYTLNTREDIVAAVAAGVDAVITDDALMARRALGIPDSDPEPGEGDVTGPVVEIRTPELVSHEFRSRTLRLRWRAEDPAGLGGYEAQLRRAGGSGWRPISLGGRPARRYVAHEGMTYDLRVRAQDNFGNLGDWAQKAFTVPLDERAKPIRLTRAWARVKRSGAWNAGVARTARAGAKASLDFTGSRVRVIGPLLPKGGRLQVRLDGARRVFSVRGRGERHVLFDSGVMAPGDHHLEIRSRGGGPVMLDAIAPS